MTEQLKFLRLRGAARFWLIVPLLAALGFAYVTGKQQIARTLSETYSTTNDSSRASVVLAQTIVPRDPWTNWTAATAEKSRVAPNSLNRAAEKFENAARLSPQDYRFWLDVGRTREQLGDAESGEKALRRAVELAPNYAYPRWILGNLLLRTGNQNAAYDEFRRVAETHSTLRQQVFYLMWETSGGDVALLKNTFGDSAEVRAALALFYAIKSLPNESVQMWQSLNAAEKTDLRYVGVNAMRTNYEKLNFHAAAVLLKDLEMEAAEIGKISNGGFEENIGKAADTIFGWRVEQLKKVEIARDLRLPREGKHSLQLKFSGFAEAALQAAPQVIAVQPKTRYRLTFAVRTDDLKSAGLPYLEIVEAVSTKSLGATKPFKDGTNDWQNIALEFTSAPNSEAILIRTARTFCGADCPLVGTIWYDDFRLEQIK